MPTTLGHTNPTTATTPVTRYILLRTSDRLYFAEPHGPDNAEWTDNAREARQWVGFDSCKAAADTWKMIHDVDLLVMQVAMGPNHYSVTLPGTPQLTVSHGR